MTRLGLQHAFEEHSDPIPTEEYRWVEGQPKSAISLIQNKKHLHRRSAIQDSNVYLKPGTAALPLTQSWLAYLLIIMQIQALKDSPFDMDNNLPL